MTIYKASAGSGKTFTLAVQYIKLLVMAEEMGEYSRILAVTFTNKATAEMKDRILSQLYGIGHGLSDSKDYFDALRDTFNEEPEGAAIADDEVRRRCRLALHQILHDYNRFRVQTIDAFFQTILRGLAHELGLTANLQVEISDAEVLSKAVDRIVERLQDEPQVFEWLFSLVRDRIANDQKWEVTKEVKNFGRAIFNEDYLMRGEQLRERLSDAAFMRGFIKQMQEREEAAIAQLKSWGEKMEQAVGDSGLTYGDISNGKTLAAFVEKLKSGDIDAEVGTRIQGWVQEPLSLLKKADQRSHPEWVPVADEISWLLGEATEHLERVQFTVNSARLARAHLKPLCLLDAIDREVADINAETSRFNLAKTPILLNRMVGESDAPFVFEKMGAMLRHVMIDEFQDTSRLQWHNFRVLLLETLAKGGRNLLVGDVKQSIYRWRGGDWRVLGNLENTMTPKPQVKNLDINRRSASSIVDFNNEFFLEAAEKLDKVSAAEIQILKGTFAFKDAYADVHQETDEKNNREGKGIVCVTLLDPEQYKRRDDWQPEILEEMKEQVRQLHAQGLDYAKMTILVRNNADMAPIIESFALDEDMPPIVSDEAFLLSASPAVNSLIAALRVLDNPADVISDFYLRSHEMIPAEGLDPELAHLPLYELLETLYRVLHLEDTAHQDAYLFGFFDAVLDFLHSESSDIHAFLNYWDEKLSRQSIPAGQVNGIRIITVHKAKGLQFHTVLMPFCTWALERDRATDLLWCTPTAEPYNQLTLLPITPNSKTAPRSVFATDYAESHLLSRLDELNALYVGFTRPKKNFYAWAVGDAKNLDKGKRTVGDLIAAVIPCGCVIGSPSIPAHDVSKEAPSEGDGNRLIPHPRAIDVDMKSFPVSASFRQSNRSQQFMDSLAATAGADADEDYDETQEYGRQQSYIETGRLLHSVLQQINTLDDVARVLNNMEQEGVIVRYAPDGSYVSVRRSDLENWLSRGFDDERVKSWFSGDWLLFNECSIVSLNASSHQPETHRPDRVMVSPDGARVVVVDFKFGRHREEYEGQVRNYMSLLASMYPTAQIEGYLWLVYSARIQAVK